MASANLTTKEADSFKPHGKRKREEMDGEAGEQHSLYGSDSASCEASSTASASAEIQRERLKQLLPGSDAELRSNQKKESGRPALVVKFFECELCGKRFTNGQKKGGHKRACKQKLEQQGLYHLVAPSSAAGPPPSKKRKHAAKKKKRKREAESASSSVSATSTSTLTPNGGDVDRGSSSATRMKLGQSSGKKKRPSMSSKKKPASDKSQSPGGKAARKTKSKQRRHQQMVKSINESIDAVLARKLQQQQQSSVATASDGDSSHCSEMMDLHGGDGDGDGDFGGCTATTVHENSAVPTLPMSNLPPAVVDSEGSDTLFTANTFGTDGNNSLSCNNQLGDASTSSSIGQAQPMNPLATAAAAAAVHENQLNLDPNQLSHVLQLSQFNNLLSALAATSSTSPSSSSSVPVPRVPIPVQAGGSTSGATTTQTLQQQSPNGALLQLLQYFAMLQSLSSNTSNLDSNHQNLQTAMANNAALQSLPFQFFDKNNNNNNNAQQ